MSFSMSNSHVFLLILIKWNVTSAFLWSPWQIRPQCLDGYKSKGEYGQFKCVRKDCPAGYFGDYCEKGCSFPYYGKNCQFMCDCGRRLCNVVKGCPPPFPFCPDGYLGKYCETDCPYPNYGQQCQRECLCPKVHCNISSGCIKYMNDSFKIFPTKPSEKHSTHENDDKTFNKATPGNSSHISWKNMEKESQPFAMRRSTVSSASTTAMTTDEKGYKLITGGKIYQRYITDVHTEGNMEAKARHQVKELPCVNIEILWSIVVLAVLTVSLIIGHIYLTFSKRLQRRRMHVQSSENVYSIADDE